MNISDKHNKFALNAVNNKYSNSKQITLVLASVICLALNYLLVFIAKHNQDFIENFYSRGFFKGYSHFLTGINKWFAFSLSEVVYALMILTCIVLFILIIRLILLGKFRKALTSLLVIILILSGNVLYYQLSWGLNNYRYDVETLFELGDRDIGIKELASTFEYLVLQTNKYKDLSILEEGITVDTIMSESYKGYENLSLEYDFIDGNKSRVKPLLISPYFSLTGYTGIYLPLFSEANINDMPHISGIGFTAMHELAHQKGFASEDEANFLGFLGCMSHEEAYYKYSGYQAMMVYVGNSLYDNDKELFSEIADGRSDLVLDDMRARIDFWSEHVNETSSEVSDQVNDAFLKANNQPDGIINYSNVTGLFVNAYLDGLFEEYIED